MLSKPLPIRLTVKQDARLSALAASGDFTKQELVRLAVEKLFERLDAGEEVVVQKVLRAAGAGAGACSDAQVAKAGSGGKKAASGLSFSGERHRRQRQAVFPMDEKTQP